MSLKYEPASEPLHISARQTLSPWPTFPPTILIWIFRYLETRDQLLGIRASNVRSQFENKHGSYLKLIDFVYHSILIVRVIKNTKKM